MAKTKVLVIEDDRSLAEVMVYNLKQAGYETIVAHDGQDGLLQAQIKTPDIVILDLMLPVIDGHDVCRRLRADSSLRDLMIIMLTAKAEETDELIGFSLGAYYALDLAAAHPSRVRSVVLFYGSGGGDSGHRAGVGPLLRLCRHAPQQ